MLWLMVDVKCKDDHELYGKEQKRNYIQT